MFVVRKWKEKNIRSRQETGPETSSTAGETSHLQHTSDLHKQLLKGARLKSQVISSVPPFFLGGGWWHS